MNQPTLRPAKNPGPSRFAGNFAAALVSLAAALLAPGAAQAATGAMTKQPSCQSSRAPIFSSFCRALLALFFCYLGGATLDAQVVQYTDRAAWEAAVVAAGGTVQTENFNDRSAFTGVDGGVTVGPPVTLLNFDTGDTLTTPAVKIFCEVGGGGQQFSLASSGAAGEVTDGTPYLLGFGTTSGAPKIRMERPNGVAAMAWGVEYRKASTLSTWRAELVPVTGSATTYTLPSGTAVGFIGWVATSGYLEMKSLRLFTPSAGYSTCGYDNVSVGLPAPGLTEASIQIEAPEYLSDEATKDLGVVDVPQSDIVFTARNTGTIGLTGLLVNVDGADAGQWQILTQPAATLAVGATTTWTMRFLPTSRGNKTAVMHLASSVAGPRNPYDITLTGISSSDIVVEQPGGTIITDGGTKGFGNGLVGSPTDLIFTIKNPSGLDLSGLGITIDGVSASEFSVVASPNALVAVGGSTTFTVRFTPASLGFKSAALHIASDVVGAKNPYDINLTGSGAITALAGSRSVGPTGDYASLTAAISAIQAHSGPTGPLVLELQPAYVSTVETFPLVFSTLGTTAANTLTIRPQAGATALSISSADTTAATVDLNGAQFVTIDGRPGGVGSHAGSGVGTASQLTIANTAPTATGNALRFINEASNNTLRYTTLRSRNALSNSGAVLFFMTTGANGNDNNTIEYCNIGNDASTTSNGIVSTGSAGTITQNNSGNIVSNCNIFNFSLAGVRLSSGNTDWTISGNSFYQTANPAAVTGTVNAININNNSGNNFTVTGNFIGGGAPNCGGTAWTTTGTSVEYEFQGIRLNVGTTTPSSVHGNTIANMVWTSSSIITTLPGVWSGIYVEGGAANIGTVTGNTIGSGTGTGSISVTTSGSGGTSFGIAAAGTGTRVIANNTIGSITTSGSGTTISASLVGIQVTAGANTISNNTVGSTTTANSLNAATSSTGTTGGQRVTGIFSSSTTSAIITGNTVANLNNNYAGTATSGHIRGIFTSAGVNTITGNTVRNLSTTSQNLTTGMSGTLGHSGVGIGAISTTAGQTVSQNTVHSLANTAAAGNVNVTGIYFAVPTSGANVIARNFVHSLAVSSSSPSSQLNGMQFVAGSFTAQNNLVRVGLDASGSSTAGASLVRGIFDNGTTAGRNFYHNSVYLGGTQTTGSASSRAFDGTSGVSNTRTYQNNLFVNARSNSGGTGKHYAVTYGGTTVNPTGLTAGGNLFLASGTGGVIGLYNATDRSTLAAWQAATGQDATSLSADPLYLSPTGTAATVDLHLPVASPANNAGLALAAVTVDFDGGLRSLTTPDIGADEIGVAANAAPVAGADGLNRPNTTRVAKVLKATLLANDSDADSDTLTLTAVGNALPAGATVTLAGNFVVYTAPANNAGNGSFTYTLSAGAHTVTGTVTVTETSTSGSGPGNPNSLAIVPSGADFAVTFLGVPGGSYRVQYTTSTGEPYTWNEFAPPVVVTAAANGVIPHTDVNPPEPMRFYRAVSNP